MQSLNSVQIKIFISLDLPYNRVRRSNHKEMWMGNNGSFDAASRILEIASEYGWSQHMLSRHSGIPQLTIASWSTGRRQPSIQMIEKACNAFNMTLQEFFTGEGHRKLTTEEVMFCNIFKEMSEREKCFVREMLVFTVKWMQNNP